MKILKARPATGGGGTIAYADVEVCPGVKIFDVRIVRSNDGSMRAYARNTAFDHAAVAEISKSVIGGACLELTTS
jgi:hypothetical protein